MQCKAADAALITTLATRGTSSPLSNRVAIAVSSSSTDSREARLTSGNRGATRRAMLRCSPRLRPARRARITAAFSLWKTQRPSAPGNAGARHAAPDLVFAIHLAIGSLHRLRVVFVLLRVLKSAQQKFYFARVVLQVFPIARAASRGFQFRDHAPHSAFVFAEFIGQEFPQRFAACDVSPNGLAPGASTNMTRKLGIGFIPAFV